VGLWDMRELRALREAQGLTQADLAERVGKSEKLIRAFELGELRAHWDLVFALAGALDVSVDKLLGYPEGYSKQLGEIIRDVAEGPATGPLGGRPPTQVRGVRQVVRSSVISRLQ
jgi:transcriptional regulator with XRE-family HTH domain